MNQYPAVVIGAGPVGLAAAAHLRERGREVRVLERGDAAGASVSEWSHVRLFSPWAEVVDPAAARLLDDHGWQAPEGTRYPTGGDWVREYLQPLADALGVVTYGATVVGVAKAGRDLVVDAGRDEAPYTVHVRGGGTTWTLTASAVIDASGTWTRPNPLGADGYPAPGEAAAAERIAYQVPDFTDPATRERYAGRHVAVAGTGASAMTVLVGLAELARTAPQTRVSWLVRRPSTGSAFGGGEQDQLVARGALGQRAQAAVASGLVRTRTGFKTTGVVTGSDGLTLESADGQSVEGVDEVIAVTGFRPDLSHLGEVRLDLDSTLQAPRRLAPLIDPNVHSCGTVYPHGAEELRQPDTGLYLVGMKSYGRAPTFLAMTGYEQVRSVAAHLVGDLEAAARVELTLPDTGVCGGAGLFDEEESASAAGCCGGTPTDDLLTIGSAPAR